MKRVSYLDNDKGKQLMWLGCVEEWLTNCLGSYFLRAHRQGIAEETIDQNGGEIRNMRYDDAFFAFAPNRKRADDFVTIDGSRRNTPLTNSEKDEQSINAIRYFPAIMEKINAAAERVQQMCSRSVARSRFTAAGNRQ